MHVTVDSTVADGSRDIKFLTFNTWGLKHVSKFRKERLKAIAEKLGGKSSALPLHGLSAVHSGTDDYDVVALQEIWCKSDWDYIERKCQHKYPYRRLFYSGILTGPGLAILSKIPIESTFLYRFPINGRPSAFFRGDWYVGKSLSVTLLRPATKDGYPLAILNSHMHAPYAASGDAAYYCHRSCQAWDLSKMANLYKLAGYAVVIVGDLNSKPGTLPHKFLTKETGFVDSWEQLHGEQDLAHISKLEPLRQIEYGGTTCDSIMNTWRSMRRPDEACRLDYALIDPSRLETVQACVKFTERIPEIGSFSDHFAYNCTLRLRPKDLNSHTNEENARESILERMANYEEMAKVIENYKRVANWQKVWRGTHFWLTILGIIAVHIVITFTSNRAGWSSVFWVFFVTIITAAGLINGLIAFLFGRSELRALEEVSMEVQDAKRHACRLLDDKL
ncbi:LANO_0G01926g1_1 [Lachancea nothofagi CBS 11611]|uniref:LANO_0G01926g1_1 n=1 Tax=Lachancea nothofagi CBS 11611 TaxID=1266666 RepID=A0A1G4KF19_9SACH|nr:LANO_0G01926g1_1 [Lachancea nothofagi CBS 11611]